MRRIAQKFRDLNASGKKAFIPFIMAGDPDLETTVRLVPELERAGSHIVELGIPFSDPVADGPTIQRSSQRALDQGVDLAWVLARLRDFVEQALRETGVPEPAIFDLLVALDEVAVNIVEHGSAGGPPGPIRVALTGGPGRVSMTIADRARPFDPAQAINHPDETGTALKAQDQGIISNAYTREKIGAPESAAPDASRKTTRPSSPAARPADMDAETARRFQRYRGELGLGEREAERIARDATLAALFDEAFAVHPHAASVARWVVNDLAGLANERDTAILPIGGAELGRFVAIVDAGRREHALDAAQDEALADDVEAQGRLRLEVLLDGGGCRLRGGDGHR